VRQIAPTSVSTVESIKQRRDLLGIKGELERTQHKLDRAERALESLSRILTLIPDPIEVVSSDYSILFANRASRLLHDNEQLEGSLYYQSVMGLERPPVECPIRRAVEDDREAAYTAACDNGDVFEVAVTPVILSDGRKAAMCLSKLRPADDEESAARLQETVGLTRADGVPHVDDVSLDKLHTDAVDLPDRRTSSDPGASQDEPADDESRLLQQIAELSTQTLDAVLDQVNDGVMMIDTQGKLILTNAAFRKLAGIDNAGEPDADPASMISFPGRETGSSLASAFAELAAGGGTARIESSIARRDGEQVAVELAVSRIPGEGDDESVLLVTVQSNELKNQLLNALNLSLAAERIAGIVHQVNNNLTPAMYHADKLAQQGNLDNKTRQFVTTIQNSLNLSHEAISAVLSLTRPAVPSTINANQMVSELFSQRYLADELRLDNIEVVQRYDPGMVETTGYRVLLQQALANVIKNAQEAMVQTSGGGRLMVLTETTPCSITIRISDDGPGIPADEQKKLFDPQFTSKSPGKGSGLGLYFSREVIKRHGGSIEVKSRPGAGTTFIISLPVHRPDAGSPRADAADPSHNTVFAEMSKSGPNPLEIRNETGTGRILVIDDEPEILEMLTDILSADGHTVTTSLDTIDALKKIRSAQFDCVVCDIRMPDIDAPELSRIIKEHDSDLWDRLVFITGDIVNRDNAAFIQKTGVPCIGKPFAAGQVQALVRGVLSPHRN